MHHTSAPITVRSALQAAAATLATGSPTPGLDAAVLLAYVLGWNRSRLLAEAAMPLSLTQQHSFARLIQRRQNLEPVAYLVGEREFYGLGFRVDQRVLVPRPETELLVERALEWMGSQRKPLVVADVGTGSGCIAVSLAVHQPESRIYALDLARPALEVAQANIERHGVGARVTVLHSDGLAALAEPIDLLVSNPPYTLLAEVDPGVRRHEPHLALDGGPDGLDAYRWLLPAAASVVRPLARTAIILEIGAWQGGDVLALAGAVFPAASITLWPDLAGRDRVVEIQITP